MTKADPRVALDPKLSAALDALAAVKRINKRDLVHELLLDSLDRDRFQRILMSEFSDLAELARNTDRSLQGIGDFIYDRWSADSAKRADYR